MAEFMSVNLKKKFPWTRKLFLAGWHVYSGEFKNGKRNGEGTLAKPKGKVEIRHWEKCKKLVT